MVTTTQRRQVVTHLRAAFGISARRACRVVGLARSRWHYQPQRARRDEPVRARLRELAAARPRFGYQRLALLLRREGLVVNHKRIYRLYREERLLVRPHRGRKHPAVPRVPLVAPTRPNARWGMDFIHDACADGRRFRCLTMVDEFTRECPVIAADTSLPSARVIAVLEDGSATGFAWPTAQEFFTTVRTHTMEGMFADPVYGGNRDFAGWRLVGFPGAQPVFTSSDMQNRQAFTRAPMVGLQVQARRS